MKISNLNGVTFIHEQGRFTASGTKGEEQADVPVPHLEVGDSIIHTNGNLRTIAQIVPDAKMPDAYVKLHFEDGGAVTMPTASKVVIPQSYQTSHDLAQFSRNDVPEPRGMLNRRGGRGSQAESYSYRDRGVVERLGNEGRILHGVPLNETNPWLDEYTGK